jgi:signal transduction histidine kinase
LAGTVGVTTVLVAAYVAAAVLLHGDPVWNVLPNGLTYYANMVVAWAVTRQLLASGREADRSRAEAVQQAGMLAKEMERARHARVLHDRVLQTLETLAQGGWVADADFRAHIGTEAAWLRAFVEGGAEGSDTEERDLLAALQRLVRRNARLGLRVELNSTQLRDAHALRAALRPELVDAVVDATQEALTNTAKHAGVDTAVVRAGATAVELTVTVLDQGCGFDPLSVTRGTGIERSIRSRITELGGSVRVDSAVGSGTYVEITVPL